MFFARNEWGDTPVSKGRANLFRLAAAAIRQLLEHPHLPTEAEWLDLGRP